MLNGCGAISNSYNVDGYDVPDQHGSGDPHFGSGAGSSCDFPAYDFPSAKVPLSPSGSMSQPPRLPSGSVAQPLQSPPGSVTPQVPSGPTSQQPKPLTPSKNQEMQLYNKVATEVNATGTDKATLQNDASKLAIAASANDDKYLAYVADNIACSLGNGSYGQQGSSEALAKAFPSQGSGGQQMPETLPVNDGQGLGGAFLNLEGAVQSPDTDGNTLYDDADRVQQLAAQAGNTDLAAVAANIKGSVQNGSYDQLASMEALVKNPASTADLTS